LPPGEEQYGTCSGHRAPKEGSAQRAAEFVGEPFDPESQRALDQGREIVDGQPRVARERFGCLRQVDDELACALVDCLTEMRPFQARLD
jgi:hypothetical protein